MRNLTYLWNAIADTQSLQAVKRHWQEAAKEDYPFLASMLRATAIKSFSYPCGWNNGCCTRKIIVDTGKITAICTSKDEGCGALSLTEEDLIRYELDSLQLARIITEAMGVRLQFSAADYPNTYRIGERRSVRGEKITLYLTLLDISHFPEILTHIHIGVGTPFILLHPTRQHISHKVEALCKSANCHTIALEDILGESEEKLALLDFLANLMRPIISMPATPFSPSFPTPKGAVWSDIVIQFKDGHTVTISCQSLSQTLNFAQMGMASRRNGNPTMGWRLLNELADQHGIVHWRSQIANIHFPKKKAQLSKTLREFFNLTEEPIPWNEREKSYRTAFTLLPEA